MELASREDAAKAEKGWSVEKSLDKITRMKTRVGKKVKVRPRNVRTASEDIKGRGSSNSDVGICANFKLAENVVKYAASSYICQQCTCQVEDDEASRKTAYKT